MAKLKRFYWDSCAWLGLLNGEDDKKRELEIIYKGAQNGHYELWTSTFSLVEANRYDTEKNRAKPLEPDNLRMIEEFFEQAFIKLIPLDMEIAKSARRLYRETPGLGKKADAVHLASALRWPVNAMHTYDGCDLLHLSGKLVGRSGEALLICTPDEEASGSLFAHAKKR